MLKPIQTAKLKILHCGLVVSMITVGTATIIMPANVMANARYTVALSIILRSNTVSSLPLITLNTVAKQNNQCGCFNTTAGRGRRRTNKHQKYGKYLRNTSFTAYVNRSISGCSRRCRLEKAAFIFSPQFKCDMVLSHSHNKITPVPITSNVAVVIRTT